MSASPAAAPSRRPTRGALDFALAIAEHGHARPDGTVLIELTQSEMAQRVGLSSEGTVGGHLRLLAEAGLAQVTRGKVVLAPEALGASVHQLPRTTPTPAAAAVEVDVFDQAVAVLAAAFAAAGSGPAADGFLDALNAAHAARHAAQAGAIRAAESAGQGAIRAAEAARHVARGVFDSDLSPLSPEGGGESRTDSGSRAVNAAEAADSGSWPVLDAEWDALVEAAEAALVASGRTASVEASNPDQIRRWLAMIHPDCRAAGYEKVCSDFRSPTSTIKSFFAWVGRAARDRDPAVFPSNPGGAPRPARPAPPDPAAPAGHVAVFDVDALAEPAPGPDESEPARVWARAEAHRVCEEGNEDSRHALDAAVLAVLTEAQQRCFHRAPFEFYVDFLAEHGADALA